MQLSFPAIIQHIFLTQLLQWFALRVLILCFAIWKRKLWTNKTTICKPNDNLIAQKQEASKAKEQQALLIE